MNFEPVQTQRVGYHAEAGQTHGRRAEHGVQRQAQRDKDPCRQRNADGVIEESPEQIFVNVPQGGPAQPDCGGHIAQAALHQHHVRRVDGHIRARTDGNADVGPGQGGRVVDAVAHHGDLALLLQLTNDAFLALGQNACDDLIHARLRADGSGRAFVIAGEHDHMQAHVLQLPNRAGAVLLDHVRHGDHTQQLSVPAEEQRRFSGFGQFFRLLLHFLRNLCPPFDKAGAAAAEGLPVPNSRQPVAGKRLKFCDLVSDQTVRLRSFQNGPGQRMLALCLQRKGVFQQLPFVNAGDGQKIRHPWLAGGDGAGLVQRHNLDTARFFQRSGCFEQNAVFGSQAAAYHDRHRGSQTQRAGTADDQHGNAARQRIAHFPAQQQPDNSGDHGDGNDRGDENTRHLIGDLGDRRFGGRRVRDHLNDLGKGGVLADPGGAAFQEAGLVDRSGGNIVAGAFIRRNTFAGQRGFIDGAVSFQHHAVHRNAFARANGEYIVFLHLLHGHGHFHAVPNQTGRFRGQLHQALERVRGFALGAGFQRLTHGDQGQDHGGGLKIEIHHVIHNRVHIAPHLRARHGEEGVGTVHKGRRRAQRHQRIHVGRAVPQALEAADKEFLVDDHDNDRQKQLGQPHGHVIIVIESRQRPAPHHVTHGEVHQHQQEAHRPDQPLFQKRGLVILQLLFRLRRTGGRLARALFRRAVARLFHSRDDGLGRGRAFHAHGIGQ